MSRTYKHSKQRSSSHKLKPYAKQTPSSWQTHTKWEFDDIYNAEEGRSFRSRTGRGARQSAKNHNRSLKKSVRQKHNKQIEEELQAVYQQTKIGDTVLDKNTNNTYIASIQDADDMNWIIVE